jgi:hypothetical protein
MLINSKNSVVDVALLGFRQKNVMPTFFFVCLHCRAHSSVDVLEKQKHIDIWDFIYQLEYTKKQYI